ncbi:MAG: multicopper oxidase domain-containing protein [Gemmatimonadaceae bacterium]
MKHFFPYNLAIMRTIQIAVLVALGLLSESAHPSDELPDVIANRNVERAGIIAGKALSVRLVATQTHWRGNGLDKPGISMAAFAEEGKAPLNPGPLIRVTMGTEIQLSIRNSLLTPIIFFLPKAIRGDMTSLAMDSIVVAAGATGTIESIATTPGNYAYRAMRPATPRQELVTGLMAGGIVVDSATGNAAANDRVFVMNEAFAPYAVSVATSTSGGATGRIVYMINGLSWPNTERIVTTRGDSVHWRIINASPEMHPMHLHGFYFRVDDFSPAVADRVIRGAPGRVEVTERMPGLAGMSISWLPARAGNWIFHCHFALHMMADMLPDAHDSSAMNAMGGLVLGVSVLPRRGDPSVRPAAPKRHLRLVAVSDTGLPADAPSMRFVLEENGRRVEEGIGFSPTIELIRGEPVSITIVNRLREPTAVHWHGIELDSYYDGVPGVSGSAMRVMSSIAPRDSFEARFTPPRSGTFIYHSHMNEAHQQPAGLAGALIVRDRGTPVSTDDHVFFLKGSRLQNSPLPLEVNGKANPDTLVFHVGKLVRLRFISLASVNPNATVSLTARADSSFGYVNDTQIVQWRALSKDGADLPKAEQVDRPARQLVSMGETFDFQYTPLSAGLLRLEVRTYGANGTLLSRVPIVVK